MVSSEGQLCHKLFWMLSGGLLCRERKFGCFFFKVLNWEHWSQFHQHRDTEDLVSGCGRRGWNGPSLRAHVALNCGGAFVIYVINNCKQAKYFFPGFFSWFFPCVFLKPGRDNSFCNFCSSAIPSTTYLNCTQDGTLKYPGSKRPEPSSQKQFMVLSAKTWHGIWELEKLLMKLLQEPPIDGSAWWAGWKCWSFVFADDESHEQVQRARAGRGSVFQREGRLTPGVRAERRRQLPDPGHQHPQPAQERWGGPGWALGPCVPAPALGIGYSWLWLGFTQFLLEKISLTTGVPGWAALCWKWLGQHLSINNESWLWHYGMCRWGCGCLGLTYTMWKKD